MIINSKAVSLTEDSTMLGKPEQEVLRLCQLGYLEQSKPEGGKTRIIVNSLKKYADRSGIALHDALNPSQKRSGSLTVQETMTKLGLRTEAAVHRLIQAGELKAQMENGIYKVDAGSMRNHIIGV